jgi:CBS domain containing-hemolysin-like protein
MEHSALIFAFVLVLVNGFFVAVEFALVKVRPTQLEALVETKTPGAAAALEMRQRLDSWLSACQVGITLASLALGWVGEPAFSRVIEPLTEKLLAQGVSPGIVRPLGLAIAFACITFLHIVVGEQVPKMLAIQNAERTTLALVWPMRLFHLLFYPVIWTLNAATHVVLRALGLKEQKEGEGEALEEEELKLMLWSSAEAGLIPNARAELLDRALSMMEKTARQVLVPRTQMKCLDLDATLEQNLSDARLAGYTWLPVIRGSLDQVEGVVNVKDLYFLLARGELKSIAQVQRPVLFVPQNVTLEQLLSEFRRRNKQLAIVVDEHGGTSGLVTLSDVVAELVGKVAELGRKVDAVRTLPGGRLELPGTAQLDDLEHTLEVEFDVDHSEVTTIAGYLMAKLGRVPAVGDVWIFDEYRICAVQTEGPKVVTVRIEPKDAAPAPDKKPGPA